MTTLIPFNPAPNANFQFPCTLDGAPYNVICTFNAYAQRYYVNIYDLTGTLIMSRPLIASPSFYNVSLTIGFFETTMIYRESSATFEIPGIPVVALSRPPRPAPPPPVPPPPTPPPPPPPAPASVAYVPYLTNTLVEAATEYNAWPVVTCLQDSRLMMGYTKSPDHHGTNISDVIVRFSSDAGATWGPEVVAYNDPSMFSTVYGVSQSSSGRIFATLWRDFWNVAFSGEAGLVYSDDGGVTWSAWLDLTAASAFTAQAFSAGPVVELSNGDLVCTIEGSDTGQPVADRSSKLIRSHDDGLTWAQPVWVASFAADGRPYYESKIIQLDGAHLRCMHRTSNGAGFIYTNTSADNGFTWTATVSALPGNSAPSICKMSNDELVIALRDNLATAPCEIWVSRNSGVDWSLQSILDNTMFDTIYAATVPISDEECLVVYSDQPTSAITNASIKTGVARLLYDPVVGFTTVGGSASIQSDGAIAEVDSGNGCARAGVGHSAGHFYCEILIACGDGQNLIGLVKSDANLALYPGNDASGYSYYGQNGKLFTNNASVTYGATYGPGDVVGIEYDNGTLTFHKNGVSQGVAFTGIVGALYPAWGPGTTDPPIRTVVLNLGGAPFRYTVPAGAASWV